MALVGDMQRRVLHVRLESPEANPRTASGSGTRTSRRTPGSTGASWSPPPSPSCAPYVLAGRPRHGLAPWGSFSGWSDLIRGAIVWAGHADPAETRQELRAEADFTAGPSGA